MLTRRNAGTEFRQKITPHLAFNLQCAMDAWTVSRGWAVSGVRGHALSEPAPDFVPRCHLDVFLGKGLSCWYETGRAPVSSVGTYMFRAAELVFRLVLDWPPVDLADASPSHIDDDDAKHWWSCWY